MLFLETNANSIIWAHTFAGVQKLQLFLLHEKFAVGKSRLPFPPALSLPLASTISLSRTSTILKGQKQRRK